MWDGKGMYFNITTLEGGMGKIFSHCIHIGTDHLLLLVSLDKLDIL